VALPRTPGVYLPGTGGLPALALGIGLAAYWIGPTVVDAVSDLGWVTMIGLVALIIPGLIAITLLAVVGPVIELERRHAVAGLRRSGEVRGLLTGTAAGLVLGIQDALTRVSVRDLDSLHGAAVLLTGWPAYCLVAVGIIALWLMQSAFNSAPLHAALPGVTAGEPVAGIVLGVVAFREKVPASPALIALQVAGLIALVVGVVLVARSPVLASLHQYHGPGEHLLRRDREQHRPRPPAAAQDVPPALSADPAETPPPGTLPGR